ncbi:F0F1 ATP synthase subunit delta [Candidatus Berkelbacteria bacterium]|nr:F0F1 ATP synthase subunit delta [Candidatus Berkelbacteria bacterium]
MISNRVHARALIEAQVKVPLREQSSWYLLLKDRRIQRLLGRVIVQGSQKAREVFTKNFIMPTALAQFLILLAEEGAFKRLTGIMDQALKILAKTRNAYSLTLTTASELSPEHIHLIEQVFSDSEFILDRQIEPAILGGLKLSLIGQTLDYSLQGKLAGFRKVLTA